MSIVTKTGDAGTTGLWAGSGISKASDLIEAIGNVDELNSEFGLILAINQNSQFEEILKFLQKSCFVLGSQLAASQSSKEKQKNLPNLKNSDLDQLDLWITEIEAKLPTLHHFILPGGTVIASQLFIARVSCRRAERS